MISLKHSYIFLLVHKINHASVAHKITVFKEQNKQNMNFTQKHNLMNIYCKSMLKIVLEFLTSAERLRLTQLTHGVQTSGKGPLR